MQEYFLNFQIRYIPINSLEDRGFFFVSTDSLECTKSLNICFPSDLPSTVLGPPNYINAFIIQRTEKKPITVHIISTEIKLVKSSLTIVNFVHLQKSIARKFTRY